MKRSLRVANEQYVAEFPFLSYFIELVIAAQPLFADDLKIKIQRLDLDVLEDRPVTIAPNQWMRYYCVGDNSKTWEVQRPHKDWGKFTIWRPWTWRGEEIPGEKVKEAIVTLSRLAFKSLAFVVLAETICFLPRITVYKPPKQFSLGQFIETERQRIKLEVTTRIACESAAVERDDQ